MSSDSRTCSCFCWATFVINQIKRPFFIVGSCNRIPHDLRRSSCSCLLPTLKKTHTRRFHFVSLCFVSMITCVQMYLLHGLCVHMPVSNGSPLDDALSWAGLWHSTPPGTNTCLRLCPVCLFVFVSTCCSVKEGDLGARIKIFLLNPRHTDWL